jgi:phosphatidate cytidylyltransferase
VLIATWANDTAAYLVGSTLGRNKLWPAVSPHKTWEGLIAGLCGGVLGLLAARPWLPRYLSVDACVALGALAGVVGPLGDLCKSMLKRAYHVKDAGHLFPGHGGMLDRIDSILFVAPVMWVVRLTLFPR